MILGENIRYLRTKKGFSQEYVAQQLGYKSFTTIQKWESGVSEPPVKKLKELADLLDADMDEMNNVRLSTADTPQKSKQTGWYTNPETAKIAQEIYDNKELSLLFDAAKDSDPEDLKMVHDMLLRLKRSEQNK